MKIIVDMFLIELIQIIRSSWLESIAASATAYVVALFTVRFLIKQAKKLNLMDKPDERKAHVTPVPTLGGIGIFLGFMLPFWIWIGPVSAEIKGLICALIILFLTGIWDDLKDLKASKKFIVQFLAAIIVMGSGIRIETLNGIFGIHELPTVIQYGLTLVIIVGITNAVNLLDGLDGLAGGIACMNFALFAVLFALSGNHVYSALCLMVAASILGFLKYNFNPAKIFMGDTGSLVLGFLLSVVAIQYLKIHSIPSVSPYIIVYGICVLPVFDTIRVFGIRMLKGRSPFSADKNHMHHILIKSGFNHKQSSLLMYLSNFLLILAACILAYYDNSLTRPIIIISCMATVMAEILTLQRSRKIQREVSVLNRFRNFKFGKNQLLKKLAE